ncbi:protein of unknown function [Paraburkholderia kururiensis]
MPSLGERRSGKPAGAAPAGLPVASVNGPRECTVYKKPGVR